MADRFENFSKGARRALTLAQEEALRENSNIIEPYHILLGISREARGLGAVALVNYGVTFQSLRERIEAQSVQKVFLEGNEASLSSESEKVIEIALARTGRNVDTNHLLLGVLELPKESFVIQVLSDLVGRRLWWLPIEVRCLEVERMIKRLM